MRADRRYRLARIGNPQRSLFVTYQERTMGVSGMRWWNLCLLMLCLSIVTRPALAQVDAECDLDGDGVVDNLPADYNEEQQYLNLLNFYAVTMGISPLSSPAALEGFKLVPSLELSGIPQLDCVERAVFGGYKTEHTNKSPVFPRLRVTAGYALDVGGMTFSFYGGLSGVPPVKLLGVTTGIIGGEAGVGFLLAKRLELGLRGTFLVGKVVGDLAGPFDPADPAIDDEYKDRVFSVEVGAGYRVLDGDIRVTPYLGLGITGVSATMLVGEDGVLVPTSDEAIGALYQGLHTQLGVHARIKKIDIAAEAFFVPLSSADELAEPADGVEDYRFRNFFSPRLRVGYAFF
jgi:hypothetical protein